MNYEDTWSWPDIPVDEIDREEISTIYSFGHYDGPASGLILWDDQYWFVDKFEYLGDRCFWIITLTPEQQKYALEYGKTWAHYFHSGMSWTPDGNRVPERDGIYSFREPGYLGVTEEGRKEFKKLYPKRPTPDADAKIVGYFVGWR